MSRLAYHTLDVFTARPFGGNPLAVFPDPGPLPEELMQRIARELNLSETAFVLPPRIPDAVRRLRIFTPDMELPFAGHPTIGTACLLAALGTIPHTGGETRCVLEEAVGPVPVTIRGPAGSLEATFSAARLPEYGPPPPPGLAALLSLAPGDLLDGGDGPRSVSCGVPFLFIPVRSREALGRIRLDRGAWEREVAGYWAPHVVAFCRDPELPGSDLRARMFAPSMGIAEDPATGAAAAALAGLLADREGRAGGTSGWVMEQGFEMGRPSLLRLEADRRAGRTVAVRVGGAAVPMGEGVLHLP